jgi:integrase/recombinase XerC
MLTHRLEDFYQYLRFEKRFSEHTQIAYQTDLNHFTSFVKEQFEVKEETELESFHIRSWLALLKEEKKQARTINRKLSSLNSFLLFLLKNNFIKTNPASSIHSLKLPERLPTFIKEKEAEILLEEIDYGEGFRGKTENLICELLYQTGIRRSELISLEEKDIEWGLQQIRVFGKGKKERLIPINFLLLEKIKSYLESKKTQENCNRQQLLVLENGKPLYAAYVYSVVKKYLNMVTTLRKKSPHVMRHSFATHLLNNGANIQAIKELLGHSSLAATQVYTHTNIEQLKEIHRKNHPRG